MWQPLPSASEAASGRGERDVEAVPGGDPADRQPQQHVAVGGGERLGGGDGDLELARAGLGLDLLDVQALRLQLAHEVGGEVLDLEQPGGAERRPGADALAEQRELDLERHLEREPAGAPRRPAIRRSSERWQVGSGVPSWWTWSTGAQASPSPSETAASRSGTIRRSPAGPSSPSRPGR